MHGSVAVQFSDVKVNCVTKHIARSQIPITGAEFHDQIRSTAPIIPPYPHAGGSGAHNCWNVIKPGMETEME